MRCINVTSTVLADNIMRITPACSINLHYMNGANKLTLPGCVRLVYMQGKTPLSPGFHHFLRYPLKYHSGCFGEA